MFKDTTISVTVSKTIPSEKQCITIAIIPETFIDDKNITNNELKEFDTQFNSLLTESLKSGLFSGKKGKSYSTLCTNSSLSTQLLFLGADTPSPQAMRSFAVSVLEHITPETQKISLGFIPQDWDKEELIEQFIIGLKGFSQKFSIKQKPEENNSLAIHIKTEKKPNVKKAEALGHATSFCRFLQDTPPNIAHPEFVSEQALEQAQKAGLKVQVFDEKKLEEMGFGAMLAVGAGSVNRPRLVILEHRPEQFEKTIAIVGKGLTYDSGGYSIKPSEAQKNMKYDMSGSAVTLASILAIAEMNLPIRTFAVAALAENMIDSKAYRVDDILTSYSGKTIEIGNTDAEGRVVLADALYYTANDLKPDAIFEFSTLTGAMLVGLGQVGAGYFPFYSQEISKTIKTSSTNTGEQAWELPVWEEMKNDCDGNLSDLKNMGKGRAGGSISAGIFLSQFVKELPYAHIDIAGVAAECRGLGYPSQNASGWGVQLAFEIAKTMSQK